jgi:uncharacterized protein (DUF952 family)
MGEAIYKIARVGEWEEAVQNGVFIGSADDKRDGFIHLSTATQVRGTCDKYFAAEDRFFLLAVDPDRLGPALKWEPSRGGENFPHLYGMLPLASILSVTEIRLRADGKHAFPNGIA